MNGWQQWKSEEIKINNEMYNFHFNNSQNTKIKFYVYTEHHSTKLTSGVWSITNKLAIACQACCSLSTVSMECLLERLSHSLSALHSIVELPNIILSKLFIHCGRFCQATSFRVSVSWSVILSEWFVLPHPERVVRAPSS